MRYNNKIVQYNKAFFKLLKCYFATIFCARSEIYYTLCKKFIGDLGPLSLIAIIIVFVLH